MAKVLLTSADKGGGSKSTASHIAILAAQDAGKSICIVDADSKNSDLRNQFGKKNTEFFNLTNHKTSIDIAFEELAAFETDSDLVVIDTPAGVSSYLLNNLDNVFAAAEEVGNELVFLVPVTASVATQAYAEKFINDVNGRAKIILSLACFASVTTDDFENGSWSRRSGIQKAKEKGWAKEVVLGDLLGVYALNLYGAKCTLRDIITTDFSHLREEMSDKEEAEHRVEEYLAVYDKRARRHLKNWYVDHSKRFQDVLHWAGMI